MIFDVVNCSIRQLLNPELTASWEKGLTYVAEGKHYFTGSTWTNWNIFVRVRTAQVEQSNYQYALRQFLTQPLRIINRSQRLPDEEEIIIMLKIYSCKSSGFE